MPISSNATYVPTLDEFLAHWEAVDRALSAAGPLMLKNGTDRAALKGQRTGLLALQDEVLSGLISAQIARAEIEGLKTRLNLLLNKFNDAVDAYFGGSPLAAARPLVPQLTAAQQDFTKPMRDAADLWGRINKTAPAPMGLALPLTIPDPEGGQLELLGFQTQTGLLTDAYLALRTVENTLKIRREERTRLHSAIRENLRFYRQAVAAKFLDDDPLVMALPKLTPPEGGRTPAAVTASAVLVPPASAKVVHALSEDPDVKAYQLRGVPGPDWSAEDAVTIASHGPAEAAEFVTTFSLTQPGAAASFAVYVVLESGHERGSAPMTVMRPAG